jgi:DNA phosphorothioation-dependent restriction protein DptF
MNFKQHLDTLRLSAKEAIVDGEKNSLGELKSYLHINRPVEEDLSNLISNAAATTSASLILLLGNVGDGKSHLLARMWQKHPDLLKRFKLCNDATESIYTNKTYLQNLAEVFEPYSDEKINSPNNQVKTIIAINLGTLTNFLEECTEGFSQLKQYVIDNQLVEQQFQQNDIAPNPYFFALNLTDYHIYSLSKDGAKSDVLTDIIKKITQPIEQNPFFKSFQSTYASHPDPLACPLYYNYQLLGNQQVQTALNRLLVKSIITDKLIISVRLLMNLVYDLIVPPNLSSMSDEEIKARVMSTVFRQDFYTHTLPAMLFESNKTSAIFRSFAKLDPISDDNEALDEIIVKLSSTTEPSTYFEKFGLLQVNDVLFIHLNKLTIQQRIQLFLRLGFIHGAFGLMDDPTFNGFVMYMLDYNRANTRNLLPLYRMVSKAIYQWNGTTKLSAEFINLDIGRNQGAYKVSRNLNLDFVPIEVNITHAQELNRFMDNLTLRFSVQNHSERYFELEIDFLLYQLVVLINKGYRPNRIDKDTQVKFSKFVNEIIAYKSETKELTIQEFNGETRKKFKLTYTAGFNTFQFTQQNEL